MNRQCWRANTGVGLVQDTASSFLCSQLTSLHPKHGFDVVFLSNFQILSAVLDLLNRLLITTVVMRLASHPECFYSLTIDSHTGFAFMIIMSRLCRFVFETAPKSSFEQAMTTVFLSVG